jgi:acetyl esterase/lipase
MSTPPSERVIFPYFLRLPDMVFSGSMQVRLVPFLLLSSFAILAVTAAAAEPQVIELWPKGTPGEKGEIGEEKDFTKPTDNLVGGKRVGRIGNVSRPTLTVYRAPEAKATGTAVLVVPGGGYNILAWDLEGTEVCEWLNSIGVTGLLLKYRVPKRPGLEKHAPPLQDAQRALGLARSNAKEWGIDPKRIGALGASAGGHLVAALCTQSDVRTYPTLDAADQVSCRPDFTILIHPAYLTVKEKGDAIAPDVAVAATHPPAFVVMTQDDPVRVENAVHYFLALKQAKVPAELHLYPTGGHGYGLRRTQHFVTTWPDRAMDWLKSRGLLAK